MAEQHIGKIREFRHGILHQLAGILNGSKPATMEVASDTVFIQGFTVAHMIFRNHQIAKRIQIPGKLVIPLHPFGNAVDDLQYRLGFSFRSPAAEVDLSCAMGIKIMIGSHIIPPEFRSLPQ